MGQVTHIDLWFPEVVTDVRLLVELAVDSREREYVVTLAGIGSKADFDVARGPGWADSDQLGASFAYIPAGRLGETVGLDVAQLLTPAASIRVALVPWLKSASATPVRRVWAHGSSPSSESYLAVHGVAR